MTDEAFFDATNAEEAQGSDRSFAEMSGEDEGAQKAEQVSPGDEAHTLQGALEALLFVSDEPVSVLTFASVLDAPAAAVEAALNELRDSYIARGSGIALREVAGGWRLFSAATYHDDIARYVASWDTRRLTSAALETLAIVAYNQPITRAGISSIRGVNSDSSLNGLVDKGLVREAGTADTPGNPMLYATTRVFLERFGLTSLDDLPDVTEFAPDEATKALIAQRLGGTDTYEPQAAYDQAEDMSRDAQAVARMAQQGTVQGSTSLDTSQVAQSLFGVIDKIDFDSLVFESDDDE